MNPIWYYKLKGPIRVLKFFNRTYVIWHSGELKSRWQIFTKNRQFVLQIDMQDGRYRSICTAKKVD